MQKTAVSIILVALIEYEILNVLFNGAFTFPVSADYDNHI